MTNLERNLNIMKGQTYTGNPMSPGDNTMNTALSSIDEAAVCKVISELRGQIAIFRYIQAIEDERTSVLPNSGKRPAPLWEEFHAQ
ncbi:chitotriosidase-1 [Penicillium canescens]|uniref:Chitotriosidase-1 n=1 Tax=Penicillium canescens TaxID=5083 RepID=A0AAD6IPV5_PENCN|nr:chitotriosidase-1 [Penicillium canescens]KAJ6019258.1 chitotriosidase-1 [Penicillium canescens]KAJ6033314.1 chitotriosidase-1 [Penicillium canescens]KAJ6057498.1 chitotriosidase-1 [Penicillium canescens]KAJ6058814.1 chitotriosidase-1 [Penicillium canescens]